MSTFSITVVGAAILLALWYSIFNKETEVDEEEDKYVVARRIELAAKAQYLKVLSNPAEWVVLNHYIAHCIEDGIIVDTERSNKHALILDAYKMKLCQQGWVDHDGMVHNRLVESSAIKIYNANAGLVLYMSWIDGCVVVGSNIKSDDCPGLKYEMYYKKSIPK